MMVFVSTCVGYDENNSFILREIYVGSERTTYILKKSLGYTPQEVKENFFEVVKASQHVLAADYGPGVIRHINDRDERSLANFIKSKIDAVDINDPTAEKVLFDVLNNFGSLYIEDSQWITHS
jgi:hypothetical protein